MFSKTEGLAAKLRQNLNYLLFGVFFLCAAGFTPVAQAVTVAGYDWMPFNNTLGESMNQVSATLAPGGSREGWRYASMTEIESLYTALHPGWVGGWATANEGIVDDVAAVLGYTYFDPANPQGLRKIEAIALPMGGARITAFHQLFSSDRYAPPNTDLVNITSVNVNSGWHSVSGHMYASYLIRDISAVPVPAALWLFVSGLAGLGILKRMQPRTAAKKRA